MSRIITHNDKQVVTFGLYTNAKGPDLMPGGATVNPAVKIAVLLITTALVYLKADPNYFRYDYLEGSPEAGFENLPVGESRDFIKTHIDEFEEKAQQHGDIDYVALFAGEKYWIAIHSYPKSPRYTITKFNL